MDSRYRAAIVTLALAAVLAVVLAVMGASHAHGLLGSVALGLFLAVFTGRAVVEWGVRGTIIAGVVGVALLTFAFATGKVG